MLLFYIFEAGVFKLSVIELEIIAVDLMYFQNIDILGTESSAVYDTADFEIFCQWNQKKNKRVICFE